MLSLQKQHAFGLRVFAMAFSLEDKQRSRRSTEIDLSELMRIIESEPTIATHEVASKLRRAHGAIKLNQFKQLPLVSKLSQ